MDGAIDGIRDGTVDVGDTLGTKVGRDWVGLRDGASDVGSEVGIEVG